jgi:hypothetical protein
MKEIVLCSNCFTNHGLQLDAFKIGIDSNSICPNCSCREGRKLDKELVNRLAFRFFVRGSFHRTEYGGAPIIQFNEHQTTSISVSPLLQPDVQLIESAIGVGFFYYGPRLWMVGEVEPLKALIKPNKRAAVIKQILTKFPIRTLTVEISSIDSVLLPLCLVI